MCVCVCVCVCVLACVCVCVFVSYVFMHTCVLVFLPICFPPSSPVSHLPFPQGNAVRADGAEDDVKQVRACALVRLVVFLTTA